MLMGKRKEVQTAKKHCTALYAGRTAALQGTVPREVKTHPQKTCTRTCMTSQPQPAKRERPTQVPSQDRCMCRGTFLGAVLSQQNRGAELNTKLPGGSVSAEDPSWTAGTFSLASWPFLSLSLQEH